MYKCGTLAVASLAAAAPLSVAVSSVDISHHCQHTDLSYTQVREMSQNPANGVFRRAAWPKGLYFVDADGTPILVNETGIMNYVPVLDDLQASDWYNGRTNGN